LPEAKRYALAKAYSGSHDVKSKRYPRITLVPIQACPLGH